MSGFTGFSEVDIQKVQNGEMPLKQTTIPMGFKVSKAIVNQNKQSNLTKPKKISSENRNKNLLNEKLKETNGLVPSLPEEAKLNPVKEVESPKEEIKENIKESKEETTLNEKPIKGTDSVKEVNLNVDMGGKDMVDFKTKQKLMEEQNRIRKEMLSKALAVRTKQTLEEQQRLNEIRAEFKKIDDSLSNDVKILRKQIEVASLEYMEAQKQFDRKEKEYLQAKVFLHSKLEQKELLTEHLQTIIEKNEERKARKLTELMEKLDCLQNEVDREKVAENGPPQLP